MEFAPDETITNEFWRWRQGDSIVLFYFVNRIITKEFPTPI